MAWTSPASYSVSEIVTASKLNLHVRDNLRFLKGLDGPVTLDNTLIIPNLNITPTPGNNIFAVFGDSGTFGTQLDISRNNITNGAIQVDSFLSGVGGAPLLINSRLNGTVAINTATTAGQLHVRGGPGGIIHFGASGITGSSVQVISTGVNRRAGGLLCAFPSGGTASVITFNVAAGATTQVWTDGTNALSVTISGGAMSINRSAGSATFDVVMLVLYQ